MASSLAGADAEFFRAQPQEDEEIPTSNAVVYCDAFEEPSGVRWDGSDGQGRTYWACVLCGSTNHQETRT